LQPGDRLLTIDGMAAHRPTRKELRDRVRRPGVCCRLELWRGDRIKQISLTQDGLCIGSRAANGAPGDAAEMYR
jgi:hypothetical protein